MSAGARTARGAAVARSHPRVEPNAVLASRASGLGAASYQFLLEGVMDARDLEAAAARARACGLPLNRLLAAEGEVDAEDYAQALARELGLSFMAGPALSGFKTGGTTDDRREGWARGIIDGQACIALEATLSAPRVLAAIARRLSARGYAVCLTTPAALRDCALAEFGAPLLRGAISGLSRRDRTASARSGSWMWQSLAFAASVGGLLGLIAIAGVSARWLSVLLLTLPFFTVVALRTVTLLLYPLSRPRQVPNRALLNDRALPLYTLLVPLYREASVVSGLVEALRRLDYPGVMAQTPLRPGLKIRDCCASWVTWAKYAP